jgi:hypothetical protein
MIKKEYRLEDYIIAEYDRFMYTWEMNMVLGQHRIGNCFMVGNLLILEPWSHEKEGCLMLEYHERLRKLPIWNKSQYYCFSPGLRNVSTGQPLSNYFNRQQVNKDKISIEPVKTLEPGSFRLARHKLIVEENGTVSWQVYEQLNKIRGGLCVIESGILFISSQNNEVYESQSKKEWVTQLRSMPKWDNTFAWGHWNILRDSVQEKEINKPVSLPWDLDFKIKRTPDNMQCLKKQGSKGKRSAKPLSSKFGSLRTSLYDTVKLKNLRDRFSPLVIGGLQFGAHIFLYFLKKFVLWSYKIKDSFLKHHKK